ncbi:uncharacterized protein LOC130494908 [Raphanus sativus]|uniref:Uncharacterized protein LOC130494908 n=1 Tax=Raphanus sativus TaxID=3726 RepID=A0A9W3BR18_RAPSA|nr:uncharacterized protein LOC130494908 [Raphanus sativus]
MQLNSCRGCFGGIWKNRNAILYAATQETTSNIMQRAEEETHIWHEVNKKPGGDDVRRKNRGQKDRWSPPLPEFVKCNVHANWRNSSLHSGVAWIARDSNGQVKFHSREALTKSGSRLVAELRCIIWVLQSVRDLRRGTSGS